MKDNKIKGLIIILALIVIGIVVIIVNKFEFNVNYSKNVRLEINMEKYFEVSDIIEITNEVYPNQDVIVKQAGLVGKTIAITLRDFTDEQNENLINKINEKFETSLTTDDIGIYYNSNVRGRDIIKPYITATLVFGIIILAFFAIKYKKLGITRTILSPIFVIIGTQVLYFFMVSIFRVSISESTVATAITIMLFCLMFLIHCFEKEIKTVKK